MFQCSIPPIGISTKNYSGLSFTLKITVIEIELIRAVFWCTCEHLSFLLLNKTNSKIHDMMDIKTANEIRVVDNFDFKMKLINQSNYSTPRSFEAPWIIFSKTLISLFKKTSGHNYDIFDVTTHICVFFDVATRNCTVFVRNYRSQCDRSYGVTTPQSYRNGGHGSIVSLGRCLSNEIF